MNYARLNPEYIRSGIINSEYATDFEMLAFDMARLGVIWPKAHRILRSLIIQNLKNKNYNQSQMAERMGMSWTSFDTILKGKKS